MNFMAWLGVGIAAGLLAQFALRDKWSGGLAGNVAVGAIGAVIAGWLVNQTSLGGAAGPTIWVLLMAFVGAAALLWAGRAFTSPNVLN